MTITTAGAAAPPRVQSGVVFALLSAAAFGTSGSFASSLIEAGWTPALTVLLRVALGALILAIPTIIVMRGRWATLWANRTPVVVYAVLAVAGAQAFFFYAVQRLSVGVALMLEYLGVILVVLWMWVRHKKKPQRLTIIGCVVAVAGLAFVLDIFGGVQIDLVGVLYGLGAAVGLATFFVIAAQVDDTLPPVAMAGTGMALGAIVLLALGMTGVLELGRGSATVQLGGATVPWWVPMACLGVIAGAIAFVVGVIAARRLGATMASFLGLTEVMFAVLFAWLLLGQLPAPIQLVGGALIVTGVCLVRVDEIKRGGSLVASASPVPVPATGAES